MSKNCDQDNTEYEYYALTALILCLGITKDIWPDKNLTQKSLNISLWGNWLN